MKLTIRTATLRGVEGQVTSVAIDLIATAPRRRVTVGGPARACCRDLAARVTSALEGCGLESAPVRARIESPEQGSGYPHGSELAIAVASIVACSGASRDGITRMLFYAGVSPTGRLEPLRGATAVALECRRLGIARLIVARENVPEAAIASGTTVIGCETLADVVRVIDPARGPAPTGTDRNDLVRLEAAADALDFSEIRGLRRAKRALEIAAAGGHHILLAGAPGTGKQLLARRLPTILPKMTADEILETTKIFSVAGLARGGAVRTRPYRAPHYSVSDAGLAGGGAGCRPGEASLAHNGVLLADELTEFAPTALDALSEAFDTGRITTGEANAVTFPARFQFVGAVTLCPCGWRGDRSCDCRCTDEQVGRHFEGISDRLAARLDIRVDVAPLTREEVAETCPESSASIRERVTRARSRQFERYGEADTLNARMTPVAIERYCQLDGVTDEAVLRAADCEPEPGAAAASVLRVARTIADLEGRERISPEDIAEAISFRRP